MVSRREEGKRSDCGEGSLTLTLVRASKMGSLRTILLEYNVIMQKEGEGEDVSGRRKSKSREEKGKLDGAWQTSPHSD